MATTLTLNGKPFSLDHLLGVSRLQEVLMTIVQQLNAQDERLNCFYADLTELQTTQERLMERQQEDQAEMSAQLSAQEHRLSELDERVRTAKDLAQEALRGESTRQARRPRILGLGSPMRRLPEEAEEDDAAGEARKQGSNASVPLSPIKEVESPRVARGSKFAAADAGDADPAVTVAAAVAAAKSASPRHESECHTPQLDVSLDNSESADRPEQAKSSKMIMVNGIPYTQLNTIGRGGSSKVYLVRDTHGEIFALKRVTTENSKQLEAFQNEVVLLQQLRDRDSVIQVVDAEVDREKGRINIVMEAGDMDLGRFLQAQPRLSLIQIQHLWKQMLEAVQVIHQERIVHSDLKPGNFLLINGRLKVIDFGIAKRISNDTTNIQRDASVGTLSYMAPEAVKQGQLKLGRASDIWSLGIILYQMVYGHPPFAHLEPMQRLLRLNDPSLRIEFPAHRFGGGQALVEVLGSCLQRDPRRRPSLCELLSHPFLEARSSRPPLQERHAVSQEKQLPEMEKPEKEPKEVPSRSTTLSLEEMLQRSKSKVSARHPFGRLELPVVPEEKENILRPNKASS